MEKYFSQNDLCSLTGLRNSQIDYLVREGILPCIRYGKSSPRRFPVEALKILKKRLHKPDDKKQ